MAATPLIAHLFNATDNGFHLRAGHSQAVDRRPIITRQIEVHRSQHRYGAGGADNLNFLITPVPERPLKW